jgi:hypothetical protein
MAIEAASLSNIIDQRKEASVEVGDAESIVEEKA